MNNLETKKSLQLCRTFEEFDEIINKTWCQTDKDKIEYLRQMFNVDVVHSTVNDRHGDYVAMAHAIMNHSWFTQLAS